MTQSGRHAHQGHSPSRMRRSPLVHPVNLARIVDLICCEFVVVLACALDANVRTCVFSHISDQMDVPGIPEKLLEEMSKIYTGNSIWARDLMEIELSTPAPKELI